MHTDTAITNTATQREREREIEGSDVSSAASDDDKPQLVTIFLHDWTAYPHITQPSSEGECTGNTGTKWKDEAETFMECRKWKASSSSDCDNTHCWLVQWLRHCFFDSGWYSTGCSPLYLWPHYQRAAAQPWQSNWCFGMRVEELWAPPLGRGLVGAHTSLVWIPNIQRVLLLEDYKLFCWRKSHEGLAGI